MAKKFKDPVCGMEVGESDRDEFLARSQMNMPEMKHGEHQMEHHAHAVVRSMGLAEDTRLIMFV